MAIDNAFRQDYVDLANDVRNAGFQVYAERLKTLLDLVDGDPDAASIARKLAPGFDFMAWYEAAVATTAARGIGQGDLGLSSDRTLRLGQLLALFRYLADTPDEVLQFGFRFCYSGSKFDENLRKLNRELFDPFARDLLKHLERQMDAGDAAAVPASDRIVRLDHNSSDVQQLAMHLEMVESAVSESNELAVDLEARDETLAELAAGRSLLSAVRVRAAAIRETLVPALRWVAEKAAGAAVQVAVVAALALIASIFGYSIMKV